MYYDQEAKRFHNIIQFPIVRVRCNIRPNGVKVSLRTV